MSILPILSLTFTLSLSSLALAGADGEDGDFESLSVDDFSYRHPDREYAIYSYRLTDQPKKYPYDLGGGTYQVTGFGGGSPTDFYTYVDGSPILFEMLNDENNETAVPYDVEKMTEVWGSSSGFLELSTASLSTAHCFRVESDTDKTVVCLNEDLGQRVTDVVQKSAYLKITRPTQGGIVGQDGCTYSGIDGFSDQISVEGQVGLFFSNRIIGGAVPVFGYSPGENTLFACPDTPSGIYPLEVVALDGVGGKKKFDFTVEITEEQVDGGKLEWFSLGTVPDEPDSDGDGVSDTSDAFPNDPAASVDTDGDGKPDDWNEDKSAADSTSDPALVLDDDDDGDGVADEADFYPKDASRSIAQFGDALDLISDAGLRNCIQNQFNSSAGTDSVLAVTQLNCARAGISSLAGLELFTGIEELELRSNPIQDLTPVASLNKLKVLMLGEMGAFVGLPVADFSVLGALVGLESLEIGWVTTNGGVPLGDASWISNLTGLRTLMLRGMGLNSVEFLQQLPSLLHLSVSHSEQLDLSPLVYTPNLLGLGVDGMGLGSLTEIPSLSSLTDLDVRTNNLTDLVGIDRFQNLRTLYASENTISDLQALSGAPQLQTIGLTSNDVSSIAPALLDWGTPLSLTLTDNPVNCSSLNQLSQNQNVNVFFESDCVQSEDSDDDGVPDNEDDFPDDPAASLDTDGDGKPDDWNEGQTAADSTSDPALVLDDDDDWDGILDVDDVDPKTLTLRSAFNYAKGVDGNYAWYACIAGLQGDFSGGWEEPTASWSKLVCNGGEEGKVSTIGAVAMFDNLTELNLANNRVTDLSPLTALSKLKILEISDNPITWATFPKGLSSLENLKANSAALKAFAAIPDYLGATLEDLEVGYQYEGLTGVGALSAFPRLNRLNISGNEYIDWAALPELRQLVWLGAHGTFLDRLDQLLPLADNLQDTDLRYNRLKSLASINLFTKLSRINVAYNAITDITDLNRPLTALDLGNNDLRDLSPLSIYQDAAEGELSLWGNPIRQIGELFAGWTNLRISFEESESQTTTTLSCQEIESVSNYIDSSLIVKWPTFSQCRQDPDRDYFYEDEDAFPNDPAASVDTDGDGKPDDWNDGKSAADSTSDPVLVLDDDDDNDGVADVDDAYPRNASLQSNRNLESIGDEFPASVGTVNGSEQNRPAVGGLSDGSFVVTWMVDSAGMATDIIGQRYANDGSKLGSEFLVNTTTIDYQSRPAVAGLANGGFVVVWDSYNQDGSDYGIYGQRYTSTGAKNGEEFRINTFTINAQHEPAVAGLVNGGFVVTWRSDLQDGSHGGIYGQRYASDGAKLGNEFSVNTTTEGYQERTLIAALKRGGFVVTWISYAADGSIDGDIYGQRYAQDGARLGEEFKVNTSTTKTQAGHSLAALQDGGFVATWSSLKLGGADIDVFGQRFTADGSPSDIEFQINTYKSADQTDPFVTGLSEGGFVVTWNSNGQDAGNDGVYGQYFAGNGMPSGDEFKVNRVPLESYSLSSSIGQDDGSFLVFWARYDLEGYTTGIYGQRYEFSAGFLPCNDYCVQTEDRMLYRFALRSEAESFPFFQDMTNVVAGRPSGLVGGAFDFESNGEFITYATTDEDGNSQSAEYFAERSQELSDVISASENKIVLRLSTARPANNGLELEGLDKKTTLTLMTDNGFTTDQIAVRNGYVRITRLEAGSGSEENGQCSEYGMTGYADGIESVYGGLLPSDHIEGGTVSVFNGVGGNVLLICSDTPVGIYPVTFQIIDGRGGKVQTGLTIEVLEARVNGGRVEWFGSDPGDNDADNDGVPNNIDAFPNDPAASTDTDGDGMPDDWNDGKSESDSTSDPVLVLDDDDDNDGLKDHLDEFPLVASTDPLDRLIDPDGDYDGDGVPNASDHFPQDASESLDLDFDGVGNNADNDDDGDGVLDENDAFRFNPFETVDSDGDGVGDFVDAAPNNGDVTSLVVSEALEGIIDTNLRACLTNRAQGLAFAGELTELVCDYDLGEVYDLTGLRAFHQLTYIELKRGAPTSLKPIHGLYKLQSLFIGNLAWDFHDFDQLAPFYSLTAFGSDSFQNVQPVELEILERLPRLTHLSVGSYFSLKTLSFVSKMPRLRQLWISYSEIEDYSQLESLYYLKTLWLDFKAGPKFSDLGFLTFSPNLKELGLGGANLEGLAGIEQARNLENLTAWEGPISDISVLADLAHLKYLNLYQQRISDITPLESLYKLETVNLAENNLSSLGTVLVNWAYPAHFNLTGNPLPCSEVDAARANTNITVEFEGNCDVLVCPAVITYGLGSVTFEWTGGSGFALDDIMTSAGASIDFEDAAIGELISERYAAQGVVFEVMSDNFTSEVTDVVTGSPYGVYDFGSSSSKALHIGQGSIRVLLSNPGDECFPHHVESMTLRVGDGDESFESFRVSIEGDYLGFGGPENGLAAAEFTTYSGPVTGGLTIIISVYDGIKIVPDAVLDSDGDGVPDDMDAFPYDPAASVDTDGDGMPDDWNPGQSASDSTSQPPLELDNDDDNDGYDDSVDVFPLDPSEWADCEGDGIGDNADTDDDNDGIPDTQDAFPCNPAYSQDSDGDGIPDTWELQYGLDPLDPRDAYFDLDQDGYLNWEEYQMGLDPTVSDRAAQIIFVDEPAYIVPGGEASLSVQYSTTDTNPNLSGVGIRVHYDSRYVSSVTLSNVLEDSLISISPSEEDVNDFDGDIETDRYIIVSWANIQGPNWPGTIPIDLFDINIVALEGISCLAYYPIRFSVTSAATGYNVSAPSVYNPVIQATLDIDGDGEAAALTDGLLIIRHLFGFSGETLINGSVSAEGTYQTSEAIANRIEGFRSAFDVDADGNTAALTDGLLIIRRLFGFSGETLVAGSVSAEGARTDAAGIAEYIDALSSGDTNGGSCPSLPDGMVDGDDGTYLTDLNSGLDWRDVNLTLGLSFNEVSTKIVSGDLSGWRFATIPEINTLISNFSGIEFDVTTYGGIELENNEIDELITLLGPTLIQGSERIVWGFHSTGPYGNSTRSAWLRDVGVDGLTDTTVANNGLTDKSVGLADHGSFLVRETQL